MRWEWPKGEGSLGRESSYQLSPSNCAACPALCFEYVKSVFAHRALQHQRTDYRAISSSAAPKFLALHCLLFAISQPHMSTEQKKKTVVDGEITLMYLNLSLGRLDFIVLRTIDDSRY